MFEPLTDLAFISETCFCVYIFIIYICFVNMYICIYIYVYMSVRLRLSFVILLVCDITSYVMNVHLEQSCGLLRKMVIYGVWLIGLFLHRCHCPMMITRWSQRDSFLIKHPSI